MARRLFLLRLFAQLTLLVVAWVATAAPSLAAPEAHILRIDPRAGLTGNKPLLTTVIEVVQFKRLSDVLQPCAGVTGAGTLACWSEQLEKPGALWEPFPFPEQNAHLLVKVSGEDQLTKFADKTQWGKAQNQPDVGTAWLVSVDASSSMGGRFSDARTIAHEVVAEMQPNDLLDLMFFDDVQVLRDTKWKTFKQRGDLVAALNEVKSPSVSHGRDRALFAQIKAMTQDAFGSLGNSDQPDAVPLHQAMVLLSNGAGRGDPESASPSADVFHQYLDQGRFPAENTSLPKTPLPVVSVWLPGAASLAENIYRNNEAQFMQSLANPEIGGFFDIVQEGQGAAKSKTIIGLVRARFNAMWVVHWTMSCINPSVDQSFNLVFENTHPAITPDGTFKEVPIGIDPTQWPLDIDVQKTTMAAQENPLYPGGQFTIYGDFCWSGDKQRAEAYFIPAGTKPPPQQANSRDPSVAKKAMQQLQAEHMLATAVATGDAYVTFTVPDDAEVLEGTGDNTVARLVVYDNKAHRASAVDEKSVLSLKATKKPLSLTLIAGIAGLLVVIVLLVVVLLRGGGGGRKRGGGSPPQPPGMGPGYNVPPGGYGVPPQGGGYGASPPAQALFAMPPRAPAMATPSSRFESVSSHAGPPPVVQVPCPACGMPIMATPGLPSVCFSCGQPLSGDATNGGGGGSAPRFPVTDAMNARPLAGPPGPYASPAFDFGGAGAGVGGGSTGASIRGSAGLFMIRPGAEVRVGRDPATCSIYLGEPRVSGVHATLKFEEGHLMVRDETSNNGTWVSGARIAPGMWTPLAIGTPLRFGPVEFTVQFDG